MYYCLYQIISQLTEARNHPEDIGSYVFKDREVKMTRPRYDPVTGEFLGLYDTIGFLVSRGNDGKHFLSYGCDENNSKVQVSTISLKEEYLILLEAQCLAGIVLCLKVEN